MIWVGYQGLIASKLAPTWNGVRKSIVGASLLAIAIYLTTKTSSPNQGPRPRHHAQRTQRPPQPSPIMPRFPSHLPGLHLPDMRHKILRQRLWTTNPLKLFNQFPILVKQHRRRPRNLRMPRRFAGTQHINIRPMPKRLGNRPKHRSGFFACRTVLIAKVQDHRTPGFQGFAVGRGQCRLRVFEVIEVSFSQRSVKAC